MGYFSDAVNAYTESLIKSYSKEVIDKGVSSGIINLLDGKSLLNEIYDENGKVSYAYLDVQILNYLRNNIAEYILECINEINDGDDFKSIELPLGYFFGRNYFLSNGIKVPIELEVIGHQDVFIEKNVETVGLNTTILEINLVVELSIRSVIPFQTDVIESITSIPLGLEILNNDIPYYLGDILK
jgi:sporulation protein YunB